MRASYRFFRNRKCKYFPCHKKADRRSFNCLFCYCPLYPLGGECGGSYKYTEKGVKDCSDCIMPHSEPGYAYVRGKIDKVIDIAEKT